MESSPQSDPFAYFKKQGRLQCTHRIISGLFHHKFNHSPKLLSLLQRQIVASSLKVCRGNLTTLSSKTLNEISRMWESYEIVNGPVQNLNTLSSHLVSQLPKLLVCLLVPYRSYSLTQEAFVGKPPSSSGSESQVALQWLLTSASCLSMDLGILEALAEGDNLVVRSRYVSGLTVYLSAPVAFQRNPIGGLSFSSIPDVESD